MKAEASIPHCDQYILHGPGECEYCDQHPQWQKAREIWGINFTGHHDPSKTPCPSELRRPLQTAYLWGGNIPKRKA